MRFYALYIFIFLGVLIPAESSGQTTTNSDTFSSWIQEVQIIANRFDTEEEMLAYYKLKYRVRKIYPMAMTICDMYKDYKTDIDRLDKKRAKRKFSKKLEKELKNEYKDMLKNLYRDEGQMLLDFVERELDMSFYEFLSEVKSPQTAVYWSTLGKFYGYKLKDMYDENDPENIKLEKMLEELGYK